MKTAYFIMSDLGEMVLVDKFTARDYREAATRMGIKLKARITRGESVIYKQYFRA